MRKNLIKIALGLIVGILFYGFHNFRGNLGFLELLLSGLLGVVVSFAFSFVNRFLNKYIRWKQQTGLRLLSGIVLNMAIGWLVVHFALTGYGYLTPSYDLFSKIDGMHLKVGVLLFCIVLIYNIIYFAFYSYKQYDKGQVMEIRLKRKQTELQLAALKSQISPHFLFNCLNSLSALFQKDVDRAERFIRALADSYDYTLKSYTDALVTVQDELNFVESYAFLMTTRFDGQIFLSYDLPEEVLKSKIPPLTLQMLVENAIKHNVTDADEPLRIQIQQKNGAIWVINNKTKSRAATKSLNIGLGNIASRYQLLAQEEVEVLNDSNFTVKLPVLS
nr:histidine kinase [Allomuricauda sp.]